MKLNDITDIDHILEGAGTTTIDDTVDSPADIAHNKWKRKTDLSKYEWYKKNDPEYYNKLMSMD